VPTEFPREIGRTALRELAFNGFTRYERIKADY
jgi:hypothetical protein